MNAEQLSLASCSLEALHLLSAADWVMPVLFGVGIFAVIFFGIFGIAAMVYGNKKDAVFHAVRAEKRLDKTSAAWLRAQDIKRAAGNLSSQLTQGIQQGIIVFLFASHNCSIAEFMARAVNPTPG